MGQYLLVMSTVKSAGSSRTASLPWGSRPDAAAGAEPVVEVHPARQVAARAAASTRRGRPLASSVPIFRTGPPRATVDSADGDRMARGADARLTRSAPRQ